MNKACSKLSNVEFEDVGVGNGEGSVGKRREAIRKGPSSLILSVFLSLPRLCNLKDEGQSP